MSKECKVVKCDKEVAMKGFCVGHYVQYTKGDIDIAGNLVEVSIKITEPSNKIKLPRKWNYCGTKQKTDFIRQCSNVPLLMHILFSDSDTFVKVHVEERILALGIDPPKEKSYSCKIKGCKGGPNTYGNFSKGFCHTHHQQFNNGIIDEEGRPIRDKIDNSKKKYVECKVEGCKKVSHKKCFCRIHYMEFHEGLRNIHGKELLRFKKKTGVEKPLTRFNKIVSTIAFMRKELKELRKSAFLDKGMEIDLLKQISYLDDNLKFIHNPSFILGSVSILTNRSMKILLKGEEKDPIDVSIELIDKGKKRKFSAVLMQGQNTNVAISNYELVDNDKKDSKTVFFLKDMINSKLPFECEAKDLEGNLIHRLKITEEDNG